MIALDARQKEALRDPQTRVVNLVEMGHPTGTAYLWSGTGTLSYGGNDYVGAGLFGTITGLEWGSDPRISEVGFVVAGVPADILDVMTRDLKGYQATIYQALLRPDDTVIGDLIVRDVVDLDIPETTADDSGTFTVLIKGQSGFWQLETPSLEIWSSEDQQATYAGDTGMDALSTLEDLDISWTRT